MASGQARCRRPHRCDRIPSWCWRGGGLYAEGGGAGRPGPERLEPTRPSLREPATVIQVVGLFDPVGTGEPRHHDRRLPPSVVPGFQITADDERRNPFPSARVMDPGVTDGGRFLDVTVAGWTPHPSRRLRRSNGNRSRPRSHVAPAHLLHTVAGFPVAPPGRRDDEVTQAPTRLRTASKSRTGRTSMLPVPIQGNSWAIRTASSRLSASIRL